MSERQIHSSPGEIGDDGGKATPGIVCGLSLAATPTFAVMALLTAASSRPDILCMPAEEASPLGGMAFMYLLMSVFHCGPWWKLIDARRTAARETKCNGGGSTTTNACFHDAKTVQTEDILRRFV